MYSGLFAAGMDAAALEVVIAAALDGGAAGVSIFSARAMDDAKWKVLAKASGTA